MPRPKTVEKRSSLHVILNADLRGRLDRHLSVGGKLPQAAYQRFFEDAIRQYFERTALDLAPYTSGPMSVDSLPSGSMVYAEPHIISRLRKLLGDE